MMKYFYTFLLSAVCCLAEANPTGSSKNGITDPSIQPIHETPEGTLLNLLTRSADVVGYDFRNGSAFSLHDQDRIAQIVVADNGDIYLYNPISEWESNSWIKLEKAQGDTLVARFPQALFSEGGDTYYAFPLFYDATQKTYVPKELDSDNYLAESKFVYKDGVLRQIDDALIGQVMADYTWMDAGDSHLCVGPLTTPQNVLPQSAKDKLQTYILSYDKGGSDPVSVVAKGTIDDGKIYLENPLNTDGTQWIVGTLEGNKAVFETGQYLGPDSVKTHHHEFFRSATFTRKDSTDAEGNHIYHYDFDETPSLAFTYQSEKDMYTTQEPLAFVVTAGSSVKGYVTPAFYPYQDVATTPEDPRFADFQAYNPDYGYGIFNFVLPTLDTNKKYLNPDNLYYCFYLDDPNKPFVFTKEDYRYMPADSMDIFPANYNDGFDMAPLDENVHQVYFYFADFDSLGVQSIYRGGGEEHRSNIVWISYDKALGITNPQSEGNSATIGTEYFDITGRKISRPVQGLVIRKDHRADGTVSVTKLMLR